MISNADMQKMLDEAAEIIVRCGITSLNDQSPPGAVAWVLTQLGQFCAGLGMLLDLCVGCVDEHRGEVVDMTLQAVRVVTIGPAHGHIDGLALRAGAISDC